MEKNVRKLRLIQDKKSMRNLRYVICFSLFISFITYGQKQNNTVFAEIKNEFIEIIVDTVTYKKFIIENILDNKQDVIFNRVEIKKQLTIGSKKEFFYILLTEKQNKFKVARWLTKKDNLLVINNTPDFERDDVFEQIYLICEGQADDCRPQVFEDENGRMWGCSEILACTAVEGEEPTCKVTQSIFIED